MFKFLTICIFALLAYVSAKPHLLATGVSYATPVVAAPAAVATPVLAPSTYYPAYTTSYATYPYAPYAPFASYATYPYFGGATYFVRK